MTEPTTTPVDAPRPKAFLSYSWSSPDYQDRVDQLAHSLVGHGVDVVYDQWDIVEGNDLHKYMERAVNDPTVTRVLLLCDPAYAQKADERRGGVGKETLIISAEVYEHADQTKFVPVVMERAGDGEVVLPTYLKGRFRIDLSDPATEAEQYERLIRNLYNKPERQRPPLGSPPSFLAEVTGFRGKAPPPSLQPRSF